MMEINQSKNHTWKVTNVEMYCDARTDVHIHTQTHTYKKKHIYNNSYINCGNDKNQRFYNNQFGSYNSYRNYLKTTIIQCNIQVFHTYYNTM